MNLLYYRFLSNFVLLFRKFLEIGITLIRLEITTSDKKRVYAIL